MSKKYADRVLETTATTGTDPFVLAGNIVGFQRFDAVLSVGDTVDYSAYAVDNNGVPTGDWETGVGTYSAADTLTRTTVKDSSNAKVAVNFAAGTKRVLLGLSAASVVAILAAGGSGGGDSNLVSSTDWRVRVISNNGQGYAGFAELEFFDGSSTNVGRVSGTTYNASSQYDAGRGPGEAFDGNTNQGYQSGGFLWGDGGAGATVGFSGPAAVAPLTLDVYPFSDNPSLSACVIQVEAKVVGVWTAVGAQATLANMTAGNAIVVPIQAASSGGSGSGGSGSGAPWWLQPPLSTDLPISIGQAALTLTDDADVGLLIETDGPFTDTRAVGKTMGTSVDWSVTMRCEFGFFNTGDGDIGLAVWETVSGKNFIFGIDSRNVNPTMHLFRQNGSGYDSFEQLTAIMGRQPEWYRMRYSVTSGVLETYFSYDGKIWISYSNYNIYADFGNRHPTGCGPCIELGSYSHHAGLSVQYLKYE